MFADKEAMLAGALEIAGEIAGRSPVAVQGTKVNLIYSRDHSVAEGLDYMVTTLKQSQHEAAIFLHVTTELPLLLVHPPPGDLEHEHASDCRCDEVGSGLHGEEESQIDCVLQTLDLTEVHHQNPLWPFLKQLETTVGGKRGKMIHVWKKV